MEINNPTIEMWYKSDKGKHVCKVYQKNEDNLMNAFEVKGYGDTTFESVRHAVEQVKSISE